MNRFSLAIVLVATWLLAGCIGTNQPVIEPSRSIAPPELVGLWTERGKDGFFLIEPIDAKRLRVSFHVEQKLVYRGPVHVAALRQKIFVVEHPGGLQFVQADAQDTLRAVELALKTDLEAIKSAGAKYKIDIVVSQATGARILGADQNRLVLFLNELIDRSLLVPETGSLSRNADPQALIKAQNTVTALAKKDEATFVSALSLLSSASADQRSEACNQMNMLSMEGHLEALTQSGRCRLYGWYLKPDSKAGLDILRRASYFGSLDASYEIGKTWIETTGYKNEDDDTRSMGKRHLQWVANQGHAGAKALLAKRASDEAKSEEEARKIRQQAKLENQERELKNQERRKSRQWIYRTESNAGLVTARTASVDAVNGKGKLFIRVDSNKNVGVFYNGTDVCLSDSDCKAMANFAEGISDFTVQRAATPSPGLWYAVKDSARMFRSLRMASFVQTGLTKGSMSIADWELEVSMGLLEIDDFVFEKLDLRQLGLSER